MGIRCMSKERTDNLIAVHVYKHGCMDGLFCCEGRFNTEHIFSDGFKPDDGWYRIADYTVSHLKMFEKNNIEVTYSDTCAYVKQLVSPVVNGN